MTQLNSGVKIRLVRIGRLVWDVLAIADASGANVLTQLAAIDPGYQHSKTMLILLESYIPRNGPPHNKNRCSPLGDDIFEFKAGPERGKKLRVLWFYDAGDPAARNRIICTHSFLKDTRRTPPHEKERAVLLRRKYLQAKRVGGLTLPRGDTE